MTWASARTVCICGLAAQDPANLAKQAHGFIIEIQTEGQQTIAVPLALLTLTSRALTHTVYELQRLFARADSALQNFVFYLS